MIDIGPITDWIIGIALFGSWIAWNWYRERGLKQEYERNKNFEAPETEQLKWDMRHIREDISLLCHLMTFAVILLAKIAFK
jgi:hypothetical protein